MVRDKTVAGYLLFKESYKEPRKERQLSVRKGLVIICPR